MEKQLKIPWTEIVGVVESSTDEWVVIRASTTYKIAASQITSESPFDGGIIGETVGVLLLDDGSARLRVIRMEGVCLD